MNNKKNPPTFLERKYTRFRPADKIFAIIDADYKQFGKVRDISMGGMAFEYVSDDRISGGLVLCDIVISDRLFIPRIASKIIFQTCVISSEVLDNVRIRLNRCGISFQVIGGQERENLKEVITRYCSL